MTKDKIINYLSIVANFIKTKIDARDSFVFGGIFLVWYGVHDVLPWLSYVISGGLLIFIGLGLHIRKPQVK